MYRPSSLLVNQTVGCQSIWYCVFYSDKCSFLVVVYDARRKSPLLVKILFRLLTEAVDVLVCKM